MQARGWVWGRGMEARRARRQLRVPPSPPPHPLPRRCLTRREEAAEHHGLGLGVPGQRLGGGRAAQRDRVAHARVRDCLDRRRQVAHLASKQRIHFHALGGEHAELCQLVLAPCVHKLYQIALCQRAVHHPELHHHAL